MSSSIEEISAALGLTPRRIRQLVELEGMPKSARGVYDFDACTQWYIKYLQGKIEARRERESGPEAVMWIRARTRLAKEQADANALKNAELRGQLASTAVVERLLANTLSKIRRKVLALPAKIAAELEVGEAKDVRTILDREVRGLLEEIAVIPVSL